MNVNDISTTVTVLILIIGLQFATISILFAILIRRRTQVTLTSGECECGHARSSHTSGKYKCRVDFDNWHKCVCQLYIPVNGACADNVDEEVQRLRKMAGI